MVVKTERYNLYFYLHHGGFCDEVMFSPHLVVCLLDNRIMQKLLNEWRIFTKMGEKTAYGPRKNPLDFGCNLDNLCFC